MFWRKKPEKHDAATEALLKTIREKRAEDPLIGVKLAAEETGKRLISALKDERGIHVESLLTVIGALGGFACMAAIYEMGAMSSLQTIKTKDGSTYYMGDALNKRLCEQQYSLWGIAAGGVHAMGVTELPDVVEIFQHNAQSIGGAGFGIPRVDDDRKARDLPINYVKALWPTLLPMLKMYCENPAEWPAVFGLTAQKMISLGKNAIHPALALRIVMEAAVPMSKINPEEVYKAG